MHVLSLFLHQVTMASVFHKHVLLLVAFLCLFSFAPQCSSGHPLKTCKFDKIYQLGDSISDTGNLIREFPLGASTPFSRLPYGQTFFRNATGRCSNGLLMIDYIAMAAGLPLLPPYKNMGTEFEHGVNFAVAGSTALPSEVLERQHILSPGTNSSLNVQLGWMSSHFDSICLDRRDCIEKLQNALFMVGEIGGNDYNYAIFQGKTMQELRNMVPDVVASIVHAAREVINMGATRLVIPGNFPIGCLPIYKTVFASNASAAYDQNQCLKQWNEFATYQNEQLQQAIHELIKEKPNAVVVYGDYYTAYQYLLRVGRHHGFETQRACCGIGGKYNFNLTKGCGGADVPVCENPGRYLSWDGVHLTQQGYKIMAGWLLRDILNKLRCRT